MTDNEKIKKNDVPAEEAENENSAAEDKETAEAAKEEPVDSTLEEPGEILRKGTSDKSGKKDKKDKKKDERTEDQKALDELNDRFLRMAAEYDNYRKRTQKEREAAYTDAAADVIKEILPVIDTLERAAQFGDGDKLSEGVNMTLKMFEEVLAKLGVEEIKAKGEQFDPELHNAVMHGEDENFGENTVAEVFQKGYKKGDRVIRYAMVKVVN